MDPKRLPWRERFFIKPSLGRGLGLFAAIPIEKGTFILEYTGRKLPSKVANRLNNRYLFEIDKNWTIDGATKANLARYINHSCDPNCEAEIDAKDRIMLHATRDIEKGEELAFDYGSEYFEEFIRPVGCRCGSDKCRAPAL